MRLVWILRSPCSIMGTWGDGQTIHLGETCSSTCLAGTSPAAARHSKTWAFPVTLNILVIRSRNLKWAGGFATIVQEKSSAPHCSTLWRKGEVPELLFPWLEMSFVPRSKFLWKKGNYLRVLRSGVESSVLQCQIKVKAASYRVRSGPVFHSYCKFWVPVN